MRALSECRISRKVPRCHPQNTRAGSVSDHATIVWVAPLAILVNESGGAVLDDHVQIHRELSSVRFHIEELTFPWELRIFGGDLERTHREWDESNRCHSQPASKISASACLGR
jgi:hypothetical protein